MVNIPKITGAELEVMKILWDEAPLGSAQIIKRLTGITDWKPKTIQTLINNLTAKNALKAEKINGKSNIYYPAVSKGECAIQESENLLNKMFDGSLNMMVLSFIRKNKLSKDEINELKTMLDNMGDDENA